MTNLIRLNASLITSIFLALSLVRMFGEINHRKAVAIVVLAVIGCAVFMFYWLVSKCLNGKEAKTLGLLAGVSTFFFLGFAMFGDGIAWTLKDMVNSRWNRVWHLWLMLSVVEVQT